MRHIKPRTIAMCLLGIVFILSSVTKTIALPIFADELQLYLDIYFGGWLRDYKLLLAGMVCMVELVIGIAYMIPALRRYANIAAFLALTFFVYITGDNYFFPSPLGSIESCGCFGELIHFTPLGSFLKSLLLWGVTTIIMICMIKKDNKDIDTVLIKKEGGTSCCLLEIASKEK